MSTSCNSSDNAMPLFPPLSQHDTAVNHKSLMEEITTIAPQFTTSNAKDFVEATYLWSSADTLPISEQSHLMQEESLCSPTNHELDFIQEEERITTILGDVNPPQNLNVPAADNAGVFNISWGGNDKPPAELHLDKEHDDEPMVMTRKPLPKPRGIRKLPEPEPAEDGTLDENTLRRRKNAHAARRSRMKKFLQIEQLENKVNALQTENAKLVLNNALLESEKRSWLAKEAEYKRRLRCLEGLSAEHSPTTQFSRADSSPAAPNVPSQSSPSTDGWVVSN